MNIRLLFLLLMCQGFFYPSVGQLTEKMEYDWNPAVKGKGPIRGFEISYYVNANYDIVSTSREYGSGKVKVDNNRLAKIKLRFPVFVSGKWKVAGSFEYSDEEFHFRHIESNDYPLYRSLEDKNLKSIGGSLYVMTQLKRNRFFMLRFNAKLKGDYWKEHIGDVSKYTFLKMEISPVIGWKINPRKSWGVGLAYSYTFGDPLIFPVFVYNHTFHEKWGVEAFLPARVKLRYQASPLCYINAKAKLHGGSYSIHFDDGELNKFKTLELRRADVNFSLEIEKGIYDWLWLSLDAGYRSNINFDVTNKNHAFSLSGSKLTNESNVIDSRTGGSMFLNVSLFITPSKNLLRKVGLK